VIQRQHRDDPVVGALGQELVGLAEVGDQVAVREHHTLGQPGGAAGVRQCCHVAGGIDVDGRRLAVPGEQRRERGRPLGLAEHEDLLDT
jgi:hypothetical protein